MDLQQFIVSEQDSVISVMNQINNNARGVAFVCTDTNRLLAAVSDGDIRRFIIEHGDINEPISTVANYKCLYLKRSQEIEANSYMQKQAISALPIVDERQVLCDIKFLIQKPPVITATLSQPLVIMAGGKGTRLRPYTDILPKPLIPIGNKTIVEHIMDRFAEYGCRNVTIIVNYMKHFIKSYFLDNEIKRNIEFVEEEEFLGTGGGLRLLSGKMQDTFFLSNCDILIEADYSDMLQYHQQHQNIITLVCAQKDIVIPYGTVEVDEDNNVVLLQEKPHIRMKTNTGLYVIEPRFIDKIPMNTKIDMTDVIEQCIKDKERVGVYIIQENQWMDMGQMSELEKMKDNLEH